MARQKQGVTIPKDILSLADFERLEINNAKIRSIDITLDRGCFLGCWVHCEWQGSICGFGGYGLDDPIHDGNGKFLGRQGTEFGGRYIRELIEVLGTESFKKAEGSVIRVAHTGIGGGIKGIGHAIEDRWFWPAELALRMGIGEGRNHA